MNQCPECGCDCQQAKISPETRRIQTMAQRAWEHYSAECQRMSAEA